MSRTPRRERDRPLTSELRRRLAILREEVRRLAVIVRDARARGELLLSGRLPVLDEEDGRLTGLLLEEKNSVQPVGSVHTDDAVAREVDFETDGGVVELRKLGAGGGEQNLVVIRHLDEVARTPRAKDEERSARWVTV